MAVKTTFFYDFAFIIIIETNPPMQHKTFLKKFGEFEYISGREFTLNTSVKQLYIYLTNNPAR